MTNVIEKMLTQVHTGFQSRDLELAQSVLQLDAEVDTACRSVFKRHLETSSPRVGPDSTSIFAHAQAFERAPVTTPKIRRRTLSP